MVEQQAASGQGSGVQVTPRPSEVVPVGQAAPVTVEQTPVKVSQQAWVQGLTVQLPPGSQRLVPLQVAGLKETEQAPAEVQHAPLGQVPEQVEPKPWKVEPEGQPALKIAHAPVVVLQQAPTVALLQLEMVQEVCSGFQALGLRH